QRLTGTPELHVTVTPDRANTTLFAYLYSVDLFGSGTLLSHKPYSLRDVAPGAARTLDIRLEATSWEIPAGSKLVLVVDTTDPIYAGLSRLGGSVSFSSPAASPSTLKIPLQ
ncbi:MAG: CocE/NonD family hydrolase C-terminal non-catalytic domain-containing protein, partial [Pseudoxanthomonas sp.]